ncbi:Crp/Fnr family transcriptional regulator [Clostridium sp.]|uniref:Crp/Fnr family transcriptional regulator n=1 Tax=Clostridium sp. TaxID=1506 RepID=UPI003F319353
MDIEFEIIKSYPFLKSVDKEVLNNMFKRLIVKEYPIGYSLFNSNQSCTGFSFILSGVIRVYKIGDDGKEVTLYRLYKGDNCYNTVLCALTNNEIDSFAEVEENSLIALVPMDFFRRYLLENTSFWKYIFNNLYGKFEAVIGGLEKITFHSIESRLINYFKAKIKSQGGSKIIYVTHEKIAGDIGSSREVVSRALKVLERNDVLELGRGKIKIKNLKINLTT